MYESFAKYCLYPISDWRKGNHTLKYLRELERSQWFSVEEIKKFQEKRLRELLNHAYTNVPYYHRIFKERGLEPEDIKTTNDLLKLPSLNKDDIRNNLEDMMARGYEKFAYPGATGGSTGNPLNFYRDRSSYGYASAVKWRFSRWAGLDFGTRYVDLWGAPREVERNKRMRMRIRNLLVRNHLLLDSFAMSEENMNVYMERMKRFRPKIIRGYASAIYHFAKYLDSRNIYDFKLISVISTAEKLFEHQRDLIEKVFDCKVFSEYGCREVWLMAFECPTHSQLHVASENIVLELIKKGKPVQDEELGEVHVTDLSNYAMPFIRYKNGDTAISKSEKCSCGRGLQSISSVEGRITDILQSTDGKYISAPGLTVVVKDFKNIKYIQFVQESLVCIKLNIVQGSAYSQVDSELLLERLRPYFGDDMKIIPEFVDSIPRTPSGKVQFSVSKIPPDEWETK